MPLLFNIALLDQSGLQVWEVNLRLCQRGLNQDSNLWGYEPFPFKNGILNVTIWHLAPCPCLSCDKWPSQRCPSWRFPKTRETTVQKGRLVEEVALTGHLLWDRHVLKPTYKPYLNSHLNLRWVVWGRYYSISILQRWQLRLKEKNFFAPRQTACRHQSQDSQSNLFNSEYFHHFKLFF